MNWYVFGLIFSFLVFYAGQKEVGLYFTEDNQGIVIDCLTDFCLENIENNDEHVKTLLSLRCVNRNFHAHVDNSTNHRCIIPHLGDYCIKHKTILFHFVSKLIATTCPLLDYFCSEEQAEEQKELRKFVSRSPFLLSCGQEIMKKNVGKKGYKSWFTVVEKCNSTQAIDTMFSVPIYFTLLARNDRIRIAWKLFYFYGFSKFVLFLRLPKTIRATHYLLTYLISNDDILSLWNEEIQKIIQSIEIINEHQDEKKNVLVHIYDPSDNGSEECGVSDLLLYILCALQCQLPEGVSFDLYHNLNSINISQFFNNTVFDMFDDKKREQSIDLFKKAIMTLPYFVHCNKYKNIKNDVQKVVNFYIRNPQLNEKLSAMVRLL